MKLLELIFGSKQEEPPDLDPDLCNSNLKNYIDNLEIPSDYIKLDGPFLCEKHALKYIDIYKDLLMKTFYSINLCVNRQLALISNDYSLETMDNSRVKFGIVPTNHRFEICLDKKNKDNFTVVGVDGCILLNNNDRDKIKLVLGKFPITTEEIVRYSGCSS
jgi:hypothetical protein